MKSFDKDLKKYSEKISLKVSERRELRERILSYMEYHPLPKQATVRETIENRIVSEPFIKLHFNTFHLRIAGGIFVLLLILVPVMAERSVPGEVLYILKTGVNEKIQAQLANSPYEKIEFETKLMERRIAEVRVLASEGKLTEEAKDQFNETVKEHAQTVQKELTELRTQDADSAAIAEIVFNTSLEVQSTVLGAAEEGEGDSSLEEILMTVNTVREEAAVNVNKEENKPSYVGLLASVERQTTRAYELFEAIKETASVEEIADIQRRLSDINRLFAEAKETHETDEEVSVSDLAKVHGQVQKLISFMTSLDIRNTVALENLVPVVLSDEERIDLAREEIRSIEGIKAEVMQNLETFTDEGILVKVSEGLEKVDALVNTAHTALGLPDIGAAESALTEARALITDIKIMTTPVIEGEPVKETPNEDVPAEESGKGEEVIDNETQGDETVKDENATGTQAVKQSQTGV